MRNTRRLSFLSKSLVIRTFTLVTAVTLAAGCHRKEEAAKADQAAAPIDASAPVTPAPQAPALAADQPVAADPAQPAAPAADPSQPAVPPIDESKFKWPRVYNDGTTTITVYQPAIEKWDGFNFQARFAVSIQEAGKPAPAFGVVWLTAQSNVDKEEGIVTLTNMTITKSNFPTEPNNGQEFVTYLTSQLPAQSMPIALAQISNKYLLGQALKKVSSQPVKNTPPQIIFSDEPAMLVLVQGAPVMRSLPGTNCNRVFNTSALIVQNAADGGPFYLRALNYWYKADSVNGPWEVDADAPTRLASVEQAAEAIPQIDLMNPPAGKNPPPPDIYVSTVPAELLQSDGTPSFVPIPNTQLLQVKNSDNAIILNIGDQNYYVLVSGRWFKAQGLTGLPWTYVPGNQLPADFAKIPPNSDKGNVLVSIPGTPEAEEAVIANSIPQTATINRQAATLTVSYDADKPQFAPVAGTSLQYAINTPTPVIEVSPTSFYAVSNGVWFVAPAPVGPWTVATSVPPVIYTIPVASPIHYVTYVQVYGYTDTVVYVGYTPGYYGTVVTPGGVVVYGSGYVYPPYVGTTVYVAPPPTYGYGAGFASAGAAGFLFGFAAGAALDYYCTPHWGCWGSTTSNVTVNNGCMYNSWGAHVVSTGPVYGYHGGGYATAGYNPYNGNWAAASKSASYNPNTGTYSAQRSAAGYNPSTGNYAAGQQKAGYNPNTGTSAAGERSVSGNTYTGNVNGERNGSAYNNETGRSASGSTTASGNAYNGNWNANQNRSYDDSQTGAHASSSTTAGGNAYNGTYNSDTSRSGTSADGSTASGNKTSSNGTTTEQGSSYNAKTGQTQSWDHTNGQGTSNSSSDNKMYSDSNGNAYKSDGNGGYQKSTSSGWQNADHSQDQDLNRQSQGWGDHSSGGDSRFGGGGGGYSRGGGGYSRGGGGGGGRSWR
jgi:hypothetical protein